MKKNNLRSYVKFLIENGPSEHGDDNQQERVEHRHEQRAPPLDAPRHQRHSESRSDQPLEQIQEFQF